MVTQSDGDGAGEQADSAKQSVNNSLTGTGVTSKREFVKAIKAAAPTTPASAVTPTAATPSNLVVIKNGDSSVQLDNQLKLSVDQTATLQKVTATNPDNFTYDEGSQTATLTDPTDTDAVTAEYKNVGTYRGKAISAQVTINNILKHTDDHPAPNSLPVNEIQLKFLPYFGGGIETYNVGQDEVTIKFFDEAGNQVAINGDGYITVGSLNGPSTSTAGNEYINYDNASTATYVTEDSVVKYQTNPLTSTGNAYVGTTNDFADVLGAPTSENGAVTFQLSGNAFTFLSGTTRYTLKNANHHWSYTLTTFSSATVAPAVIPTPVLTVDKSSAKAGDTVTYTLDQQVNTLGEDTMLRYQSWSEVVTLPTEVSYQQASLLDSTGAVISEATFAWDAKTHQLTVTLPEDYLQNTMALNGETYQIKIGTTVNNGVVNGEVGPATGQVTIDNGSKASNGVSTVYVAPVVTTKVPMTSKTPEKTVTIKILDVDGLNRVIGVRKISGVVGSQFKINPRTDLGREFVYSYNDASLSGVYTDNSTITLTYELSYADYKHYAGGIMRTVVKNGNNKVIETDWTLSNDSAVKFVKSLSSNAWMIKVYDKKTGQFRNGKFQLFDTNKKSVRETNLVKGQSVKVRLPNGDFGVFEIESDGVTKLVSLVLSGENAELSFLTIINVDGYVVKQRIIMNNGLVISSKVKNLDDHRYEVKLSRGNQIQFDSIRAGNSSWIVLKNGQRIKIIIEKDGGMVMPHTAVFKYQREKFKSISNQSRDVVKNASSPRRLGSQFKTLPQTGEEPRPVLSIVASIFFLIESFFIMSFKKKKKL